MTLYGAEAFSPLSSSLSPQPRRFTQGMLLVPSDARKVCIGWPVVMWRLRRYICPRLAQAAGSILRPLQRDSGWAGCTAKQMYSLIFLNIISFKKLFLCHQV
jgi:hypothetical protein